MKNFPFRQKEIGILPRMEKNRNVRGTNAINIAIQDQRNRSKKQELPKRGTEKLKNALVIEGKKTHDVVNSSKSKTLTILNQYT